MRELAADLPQADPGGYGGISKDRGSRHARHYLLEQFQPLPTQVIFILNKAGGVAARTRQAIDETGAERHVLKDLSRTDHFDLRVRPTIHARAAA